jgi:hypothetical protein
MPHAEMGRNSALQLRQKSRQVPKLSDRLKFSFASPAFAMAGQLRFTTSAPVLTASNEVTRSL